MCSESTRELSMGVTLMTGATIWRAASIASSDGPDALQPGGLRSATWNEKIVEVWMRIFSPLATPNVTNHRVGRRHYGHREQCAGDARNIAARGDGEHDRERVNLDSLTHDKGLQDMALELLHCYDDREHDERDHQILVDERDE